MVINIAQDRFGFSSQELLTWLCQCENPLEIQATLQNLRERKYADRLAGSNNPIDVIVSALTTDNIKKLNPNKLAVALIDASQIIKIIEDIIMFIAALIKYLESLNLCKKTQASAEFDAHLRALRPGNPFINLPHIHLDGIHNLQGVNLQFANLSNAKIGNNVFLNQANLSHAVLRDAQVEGSVEGANLTSADLRWTHIANATKAFLPPLTLKTYLQNNLGGILLHAPTEEELKFALNALTAELQNEVLHGGKGHKHGYHEIVSKNIARFVQNPENPDNGINLCNAAFSDTYYTSHRGVRAAQYADKTATKVYNRFSSHPTLHLFGAPCQKPLVDTLHQLEAERRLKK